MNFAEYFSDELIIRELCKIRVRMAKKRNDALFFHRISKAAPKINEIDINCLFPPRRRWHAFRPRNRGNRPSLELNQEALFRATLKLRNTMPLAPWAARLKKQVSKIRSSALETRKFRFNPPKILPQRKEAGSMAFRPIAAFDTIDKIIDCLTARYFRHLLEGGFDPASMAFRCGTPTTPAPEFHDALDKLVNLRQRHSKCGLFVAECDIKGFFDCVDHDLALETLHDAIRDAQTVHPNLTLSPRALEIFKAYLKAYTFPRNVRAAEEPKLAKALKGAFFKWPEQELRAFHSDPTAARVGVPQGGALSCVIANCILNRADKALRALQRKTPRAFTYMRYCDDMIILSAHKASCTLVFDKYQKTLKKLRLPVHFPQEYLKYDRNFWNGKSKSPYHWRRPNARGGIPWIQFVGYQVRFDGFVRIRKSSLAKHQKKITELADFLFKQTNPGKKTKSFTPPFSPKVTKRAAQIVYRFRQKLISLSVGRCKVNRKRDMPMPMCWVSGFRGLFRKRINAAHRTSFHKVLPSMLRSLDRHRERQIQRVKRRFSKLPPILSDRRIVFEGPRFFGSPFSYFGQMQMSPHSAAPTKRKQKGARRPAGRFQRRSR